MNATGFVRDSAVSGGRTIGAALKYYLFGLIAQLAIGLWMVSAAFGYGFADYLWGFEAGIVAALVSLALATVALGAVREMLEARR